MPTSTFASLWCIASSKSDVQAICQWNAGDAATHSHFTEPVKKFFYQSSSKTCGIVCQWRCSKGIFSDKIVSLNWRKNNNNIIQKLIMTLNLTRGKGGMNKQLFLISQSQWLAQVSIFKWCHNKILFNIHVLLVGRLNTLCSILIPAQMRGTTGDATTSQKFVLTCILLPL